MDRQFDKIKLLDATEKPKTDSYRQTEKTVNPRLKEKISQIKKTAVQHLN